MRVQLNRAKLPALEALLYYYLSDLEVRAYRQYLRETGEEFGAYSWEHTHDADPKEIARALHITEEAARLALDSLVSLGFLLEVDD